MKLDTGGYACPITASPTYLDANCFEYKALGNYLYECKTCNTNYVYEIPFGGSTKKCFSKIVDCVTYNSDGTCHTCYDGQNTVTIGGTVMCPVTSAPLNTGYLANIPNSNYASIGACDIYSYNSGTSLYECPNTCNHLPKMLLTTGKYACPIAASPLYADTNCVTYSDLTGYDYDCFSCTSPYIKLIPDGLTKNKCLTKILDCGTYNPNNDCKVCDSGEAPITANTPDSCPLQTMNLKTGIDADIPRSVIFANPTCHIFEVNSGVFTCASSGCDHKS